MNTERINELKNFVEEFNKKLEEDIIRKNERDQNNNGNNYDEGMDNTMNSNNSLGNSNKTKHKTKKIYGTLFSDNKHWKPNNFKSDYFDKFKRLAHEVNINDWDILRINMTKRSFTKEKDLPNPNIKYTRATGNYFGNTGLSNLSELGQRIISGYMTLNEKKQEEAKKLEEEYEQYRLSRPDPRLNPWKPTVNRKGEFGTYRADDIHSFRTEEKREFLIKQPFRVPKKDGDYFSKDI